MGRVINISDKFDTTPTKITLGEKEYVVSDSVSTMTKFQQLVGVEATKDAMIEALKIALGGDAVKELNVEDISYKNFKVLVTAVFAAIMDIDYEDADARFQNAQQG